MRLGQLARKLSLRPSDIVDFLSSQQIAIEDGVNTRLADDQVDTILKKFAPLITQELKPVVQEVSDAPLQSTTVEIPEIQNQHSADAPEQPLFEDMIRGTEETVQITELIKAPKIELQGLKVLGKIDLPEDKKKANATEPENPTESSVSGESKDRVAVRPGQYGQQRGEQPRQQSRKNPIALKREKEERDASAKRKAEAEQAKQQRTLNYQKRVKPSSPTKRARLIDEASEEMSDVELPPPPKGVFAKIARWFKT